MNRLFMSENAKQKRSFKDNVKTFLVSLAVLGLSVGGAKAQCLEYDTIRESKHFIIEIPCHYFQGNISPANLQRWLSHLDEAYEAYGDFVGNHFPCNGDKIRIVEVSGVSYWAAAAPQGCYIYWSSDNNIIGKELKKIDEYDDWSFGILHEMGHLFDKFLRPTWVFQAEITANFKPFYLLDAIPNCQYELGGNKSSLQDMYDDIYNFATTYDPNHDKFDAKITLSIFHIAELYGWDVFKQTFNSYWDASFPYGIACGNAGIYNEFIDRLQHFSGSPNIREECFHDKYTNEDWLETIERHYPREIVTTWKIGSPIDSAIIATLNDSTLTITGTGAMQNWVDYMPWFCVKDKITSVVIDNGITTIGSWAFGTNYYITSITLPNTITNIGWGAFYNCTNLTSITIPNSVTNIEHYVFQNTRFTDIYVEWETPLSDIHPSAFMGVPSIENINLHVPCGTDSLYAAAPIWQNFNIIEKEFPIPTDLSVTQTDNDFAITWKGNATSYELFRNNTFLTTLNTAAYTDNDVTNGINYCYKVKAIGKYCESELSEEACKTFNNVGIVGANNYSPLPKIYPNPTNGKLTVEIAGQTRNDGVDIAICNVVGQVVGAYCIRPESNETTIDISHLSAGMYFLKIDNKTIKIIKN